MMEVDALLQRGRKQEAALLAADNELWSHAILIATFIRDREVYKEVVKRYTGATYAVGSPLMVLFNMYAGNTDGALSQAFLTQWKSNVATIVSNQAEGEQKALVEMVIHTVMYIYPHYYRI